MEVKLMRNPWEFAEEEFAAGVEMFREDLLCGDREASGLFAEYLAPDANGDLHFLGHRPPEVKPRRRRRKSKRNK